MHRRDRRIAGFTTHMTGEVFGALREHTILGRMMRDAPLDTAAFDHGVARSADRGGLLHHLFGVRTLSLMDRLAEDAVPSYLSGLLIGSEIRSSLTPGATVHLIGAEQLSARYAHAITVCGGMVRLGGRGCRGAWPCRHHAQPGLAVTVGASPGGPASNPGASLAC
jgi:2-dehydro-3-deoxygalactonokinase